MYSFTHTLTSDRVGRNFLAPTSHKLYTLVLKIHPEIMTDQKQSGTKKPLLTHYRQQLMAHVVSSYAGRDLDIRCRSWAGNVPVGPYSPLIGRRDVFLVPDWPTVPANTSLVLVLDWL